MPRVIQVIEAQETRGSGKNRSDPCRIVMQYFTLEGVLLAENDPCADLSKVPHLDDVRDTKRDATGGGLR